MTRQDARHWLVTVLVAIAIGIVSGLITFRAARYYTDQAVKQLNEQITPKLDKIIELLEARE